MTTDFDSFIAYAISSLQSIAKIMLPLAMLFFFWHLIKFMKDSADGKGDLAKSKDMMVWSGVALFFLVGVWSIAGYVQRSAVRAGLRINQNDISTQRPLPRDIP